MSNCAGIDILGRRWRLGVEVKSEGAGARRLRSLHRLRFPLSYTARSLAASAAWRTHVVRSFLERDLPQLGITIPAQALRRFWTMLAHDHAQIWNAAEPARSLGVAETTARRYLDLLTGVYMARQLAPWHEKLGKRQVKSVSSGSSPI